MEETNVVFVFLGGGGEFMFYKKENIGKCCQNLKESPLDFGALQIWYPAANPMMPTLATALSEIICM